MRSVKTTKFVLLDTTVYIENFRSGRFTWCNLLLLFAVLQWFFTNCSAGLKQLLNEGLSLI